MVEQLKFLAFLTSSKHYVPCTRKRKPLRDLLFYCFARAGPSGQVGSGEAESGKLRQVRRAQVGTEVGSGWDRKTIYLISGWY